MTRVKVSSTFERVTHGNRTVTYAIPGVLRSLLHGSLWKVPPHLQSTDPFDSHGRQHTAHFPSEQ